MQLLYHESESIKRIFIEKGVPENQIRTAAYTVKDKENKKQEEKDEELPEEVPEEDSDAVQGV